MLKLKEKISLLTFKNLHQCQTLRYCSLVEALANPKEKETNKHRTVIKLKATPLGLCGDKGGVAFSFLALSTEMMSKRLLCQM